MTRHRGRFASEARRGLATEAQSHREEPIFLNHKEEPIFLSDREELIFLSDREEPIFLGDSVPLWRVISVSRVRSVPPVR